jgi:hypothetical protein
MRLPTAGGSTMVSQSRYACGTMRVMRDHNTSATLSRDLIPDPNVSGRGYDTSASHVWVHRLAQKPIPPMPPAIAGIPALSSPKSATAASVVISNPATEAAS